MDALARARSRHRRRRILLVAWFLGQRQVTFRHLLNLEGRQRHDRRIPRAALLDPNKSAWVRLFTSNNNQGLITVTGYDHVAFAGLLALFEPWFNNHTPWTGCRDGSTFRIINENTHGRKRIISARSCLGLVLAWYRFRGAEYQLQGWFGFTGTHANVWLRFGRRGLLSVLQDHPMARIEMPSANRIEMLKAIVSARHHLLTDVYCVADGLKLLFQNCDDLDEQSMFYNGWKSSHFITNLFVFSIDGRIIHGVLNAPGSIHDSTLAEWGGVYADLEETYNRTGGVCCVDSAFASSDNRFLIKSSENVGGCSNALEVLRQEQATSLRQAAEWGMRAIQAAFPRLRDTIHLEENGERSVILALVPLLYNYRLEEVGLNQLRNAYIPSWSVDAKHLVRPATCSSSD